MKSARLVSALSLTAFLVGVFLSEGPPVFSASGQWKITSVKICRSRSGAFLSTVQVIGSFPVYSFFVPRPVWSVNGTVVDVQPVYAQGRLVQYDLLNAASLLKPGAKNTIKFALPDHNSTKVFLFQDDRIPNGDCFEFF
jgi:hypothetical protein